MKIRVTGIVKNPEANKSDTVKSVSKGYEFYLFKSEAIISLPNGVSEIKYGDCILFEDGNNIDIKSNSSHLSFDLITFKSADCAKFLSSFNFATQKVYSPIQTYFIDAIR